MPAVAVAAACCPPIPLSAACAAFSASAGLAAGTPGGSAACADPFELGRDARLRPAAGPCALLEEPEGLRVIPTISQRSHVIAKKGDLILNLYRLSQQLETRSIRIK